MVEKSNFQKSLDVRAVKVVDDLKFILANNPHELVCGEMLDEAVLLMRNLLEEFHLVPKGIPVEHLSLENMAQLIREAL